MEEGLIRLFEEHFGYVGASMLREFLREKTIERLRNLSREQRAALVEEILQTFFYPSASVRKRDMLRARLYSIFDLAVPKQPEDYVHF